MVEIERLKGGRDRQEGSSWTTFAEWFSDDQLVVGIAAPGMEKDAWQLLAFGLEYLARTDSQKLALVLPSAAARITAYRASMLSSPVEVYERSDEHLAEHVEIPVFTESIRWFGDPGDVKTRKGHDTSSWPNWLLDIADYVEARTVVQERSGGRHSWQFRGRQILEVWRMKDAWALKAGKAYGNPQGDQPTVVTVPHGEGISREQRGAVVQAIDTAIENRRTGVDSGHPESLLQAAIGLAPEMFGVSRLHREFRASRPQGGAKIDFLGVDEDGHLHVIETKIGPDPQLGVQGLDYWAWVTAQQTAIREALGVPEPRNDAPVTLRFGLGCTPKGLMHEAARATIAALHDDIPWRIHVIQDWDTLSQAGRLLQARTATRLNERVLPASDVCEERTTAKS